MPVAEYGENRHSVQLCPNCHELFHIIQPSVISESKVANRVLRAYMDVKGFDDPVFKFLIAKVMDVEDLQCTFKKHTILITEAVREALEPYVPDLTDVDILGVFGAVREYDEWQYKVGARVSASDPERETTESLWVFHFRETKVTKVETLDIIRGAEGEFVPLRIPEHLRDRPADLSRQ